MRQRVACLFFQPLYGAACDGSICGGTAWGYHKMYHWVFVGEKGGLAAEYCGVGMPDMI